jgi:hypothetical protein
MRSCQRILTTGKPDSEIGQLWPSSKYWSGNRVGGQ